MGILDKLSNVLEHEYFIDRSQSPNAQVLMPALFSFQLISYFVFKCVVHQGKQEVFGVYPVSKWLRCVALERRRKFLQRVPQALLSGRLPLLEFQLNEEWKRRCCVELNESPETRAEGLKAMRRYITEKPEMKTVQTDEFLLRFLRARKFNYEKAFKLLENYLKAKCRDPDLLLMRPAVEDVVHLGNGWQCVLRGRSRTGQAIFVSRPGRYSLVSNKSKRGDRQAMTIEEAFRTNVLAIEWTLLDEMTQLAGIVAIIDLSGFSVITHALFLNPYHSMRTTSVVQDTMPLRFGGFHVVNQPKYIDAIFALFKPFMKEKIRERVHFHGRSFERLHEYISPDVLPKEYGGNCGTMDDDDWKARLLADADRIIAFEPPV